MITITRSIFPLRKFKVLIDNKEYKLKVGEQIQIDDIESKDKVEIVVSLDFISNSFTFSPSSIKTIHIQHSIPDSFYIVGLIVCITLFVLSFSFPTVKKIFDVCLFLFLATFLFNLVFQHKSYFKIKPY